MTLETASIADKDVLELMIYYNKSGILSENEYLLAYFRQYLEKRFSFMDRNTIISYCNFLKDLGMFFEDRDMIEMLENYFKNNYASFELTEIF